MEEFRKMLSDEEKAKLEGYTKYLDEHDPKAELRQYFDQMRADQDKAMEIATRSPFADKSDEELAFEEKHLDPMTRGLMQGGAMGGIAKAGSQVKAAFPKLKQMFQVGSHQFEAGSTAEALKIKDALEKSMMTMPGRPLIKK